MIKIGLTPDKIRKNLKIEKNHRRLVKKREKY